MAATDLHKLKTEFFSRFTDLSLFDCAEFNLLKVVLDGLKVDYVGKGATSCDFFSNGPLKKLKNLLRSKRNKEARAFVDKLNQVAKRKYIFVDSSGRTIEHGGKPASLYFFKIKELLPGQVVHLVEQTDPPAHDYDLCTANIVGVVTSLPEDKDDVQLRTDLHATFKKIAPGFDKKDQLNIELAMQKFFNEYRAWKFILRQLRQPKIYLICHYHKEGAILAMKRAKRKIIELQHGLISRNDLFYCFPKEIATVRSRALFADKILVYGSFWKKKLEYGSEYRNDQVEVVGHYHSYTLHPKNSSVATDKVLITTQTYLHEPFIRYIKNLSARVDEKRLHDTIIVKIHPAEKASLYDSVRGLPHVQFKEQPVSDLLQDVRAQVSIYSTTLYEGAKFGVPGYSLDVADCKEYTAELEEDGISQRIGFDFDPFTAQKPATRAPQPQELFAAFDLAKLLAA